VSEVVAEAAGRAPSSPGCYFLLGDDNELLYVGKASNLRRRLRDHARAPQEEGYVRLRDTYASVREVRWIERTSEAAALALEADVLVCLEPPANAAIKQEGKWAYIAVTGLDADAVHLDITNKPPPVRRRGARIYGAFPHLGPGVSSRPGIACSEGLAALYRVLWAAQGGERMPASLGGLGAPRSFDVALPREMRSPLCSLLAGTSSRVLTMLEAVIGQDRVPPFMLPALVRDLASARQFYDVGPRALRELRRRHNLPSAAVKPETFIALVMTELQEAIGDFVVRPHEPAPAPGLRRTRSGWIP
jgi:predicted GIY-YIG superfamily endonuclease